MRVELGAIIGSYRLLSEIGSGSHGRVFSAEHTILGRKVALKMLKPHLSNDPKLVQRFFAEARVVSEIAHPNIVSITDFIVSTEHPSCYIMELLEGFTLRSLLERRRILEPIVAIDIGRQVSAALMAASERSVIHRDVKPENVFLIPKSTGGFDVRLLDFGVAKLVRANAAGQTNVSSLIGTPDYMSPEATLALNVDHRSDVYAFGIVLYEMVAGHPIEPGATLGEILQAHRSREFERPRKKNSSVPAELDALISACIEKKPEARPSSFEAVHGQLLAMSSRRPRGWWQAVAVFALLSATAAIIALLLRTEHQPPVVILPTPAAVEEKNVEPPPESPPIELESPPPVVTAVEAAAAPVDPPRKRRASKPRAHRRARPAIEAPPVAPVSGSETKNPYD
jgi:serine/threonine-protein kinase